MKIRNPITILIFLSAANGLMLATACFFAHPEDRIFLLIIGGLTFLLTSVIAVCFGRILIGAFVEPAEVAMSRMLAAINASGCETAAIRESDLAQLADRLVSELENSRQRERLIADYSSDVLCRADEAGKITDLNIQSESVWEYPILSLVATPLEMLVLPEHRIELRKYLEACKTEPQTRPFECRVQTQTGRLIDLEWQIEWSQSLKCFFCLAKNITDRREIERLKAEITAMVGHDLRAPAGALSFTVENLRSGTFGQIPSEADLQLARAQDNIKQMLNLINQLLDAEKLEGGQLEVNLKIIPLSELYDQCDNLLQDLGRKKNVEITFPDSDTLVSADFDRTVQILSNLLSNAIKWTPPSTVIEVTETLEGNQVKISVSDTGPGISEERQPTIFQRFKSKDASDKILASSGLGLYLAKKLTELQGGRIGFSSTVGQGSTFWFTLNQVRESELPGYLDT